MNARLSITPADGYAGDISPELSWQWLQSGEAVMVDIRTLAERAWVGWVPNTDCVPWKTWPGMALNPTFETQLMAVAPNNKKLLLLCRSGLRSVPAAQRATDLGFEAYNVLEGFEGKPNHLGQRSTTNGWRFLGLPWQQE